MPNDDYYKWHRHPVTAHGQTWNTYRKAGIPIVEDEEAAAILLAEQMELAPNAIAYSFHCGSGLVGCIAASKAPDSKIFLTDANILSIEATHRTVSTNGVAISVCQPANQRTYDCDEDRPRQPRFHEVSQGLQCIDGQEITKWSCANRQITNLIKIVPHPDDDLIDRLAQFEPPTFWKLGQKMYK